MRPKIINDQVPLILFWKDFLNDPLAIFNKPDCGRPHVTASYFENLEQIYQNKGQILKKTRLT